MTKVAVIGAGAFGSWTALCLAEGGADVALVDMFGAGNDRSSSGGESRNIRAAYGESAFYTRWARQAWFRWQERGARQRPPPRRIHLRRNTARRPAPLPPGAVRLEHCPLASMATKPLIHPASPDMRKQR